MQIIFRGGKKMTKLLEVAGYKFRWVKKKTILDGCPCSECNKEFPKGTVMFLRHNRWHGVISKMLCKECFNGNRL